MNIWNQYSLFRLLVFFALGITLQTGLTPKPVIPLWALAILILSLVLIRLLVPKKAVWRLRWLPGIMLALIMLVFGFEWSRVNDQRNHPQHLIHHYRGGEPVLAEIKGPVEIRPNSYKALADVIAMETDSMWVKTWARVLLYFPKDSIADKIEYGDRLLIYARFNQPSPPANPGEFDYRRFLENKNIHYQAFVRQDQWVKTGSGHGNPLLVWALELRSLFLKIFEEHGVAGRDFAVATALILGMDDYLDNDIRKEFSSAGAMHVLCVSGLHVGVIMLVLNNMLFFLNRNRYTRLLRALLLLSGVWFYALLTGLAPSVLRASTMFSFVIIGMSMNRRGNIYNSLTASAFVLLMYNPFLIREVGFQLSYTAVIAIVSIQPRLYRLWRPKYWLVDKVWAITTVSIAAQIGTGPLGLYYFHQFPNYFIITNLIVIPLASAILYAGFLTVFLSFVPLVSGWISWMLVIFLKSMHYSVAFIDGLPYSATTGVFISMIEMLILFLVIIAGFRALAFRRVLFLQATLALLIIFAGIGVIRQYHRAKQQKLVVYALRNDVAIDLISGRHGLMLLDSALLSAPSVLDFQVAGHHVRSGIRRPHLLTFNQLYQGISSSQPPVPFKANYPFMQFGDKLIILVDRSTPELIAETLFKTDLLILVDSHRNPDAVLSAFQTGKVVISNKVPPWNVSLWREACAESNIPCHVIRDEGAFVWER
jgi:competence protein ComEC